MTAIECTGCGKGTLEQRTVIEDFGDGAFDVTHILCNECGARLVDETEIAEAEYVKTQQLAQAIGVSIRPSDVIDGVWGACLAKVIAFETAVREMRQHQREYFKTRSPDALQASKKAERDVDRLLERKPETQGRLF